MAKRPARLPTFPACLQHGTGTAEGIVAGIKAAEESAKLRALREGELRIK